jgi:hypothetical protein
MCPPVVFDLVYRQMAIYCDGNVTDFLAHLQHNVNLAHARNDGNPAEMEKGVMCQCDWKMKCLTIEEVSATNL